jgi:hypothetical protein
MGQPDDEAGPYVNDRVFASTHASSSKNTDPFVDRRRAKSPSKEADSDETWLSWPPPESAYFEFFDASTKSMEGNGQIDNPLNFEDGHHIIMLVLEECALASTNLQDFLALNIEDDESVSENMEAVTRYESCKLLRKHVLRYIVHMDSEQWVRRLGHANDLLATALTVFEDLERRYGLENAPSGELHMKTTIFDTGKAIPVPLSPITAITYAVQLHGGEPAFEARQLENTSPLRGFRNQLRNAGRGITRSISQPFRRLASIGTTNRAATPPCVPISVTIPGTHLVKNGSPPVSPSPLQQIVSRPSFSNETAPSPPPLFQDAQVDGSGEDRLQQLSATFPKKLQDLPFSKDGTTTYSGAYLDRHLGAFEYSDYGLNAPTSEGVARDAASLRTIIYSGDKIDKICAERSCQKEDYIESVAAGQESSSLQHLLDGPDERSRRGQYGPPLSSQNDQASLLPSLPTVQHSQIPSTPSELRYYVHRSGDLPALSQNSQHSQRNPHSHYRPAANSTPKISNTTRLPSTTYRIPPAKDKREQYANAVASTVQEYRRHKRNPTDPSVMPKLKPVNSAPVPMVHSPTALEPVKFSPPSRVNSKSRPLASQRVDL